MKNKSAVISVLGLALLFVGSAYAASGVRGAKSISMATTSTTPITPAKGPVVVYSVILGTGAVTDYIVLFDSANYTAATGVLGGATFRGRYHPVATAVTEVTFDPPLQFNNGLTAVNATALTANGVVYESGRVTQGY